MPRLDHPTYLDHLRTESARFREVLAACDPGAAVPSCPDWTAADLLWHLGGEVQHFWHHVIATRPAPPEHYDEPARPASYDDLLAFFDEAHGRLVDVLAAADPEDPAWSWSGEANQTVAFTYRRQAHEALIHRVDAELAAGTPTPLPAALAADGVDEILDWVLGGLPAWGRFDPLPQHVEYRMNDVDASVWTQLGTFSGTSPDGVERHEPDQHVVAAPGAPADLVVTGTAEQLDRWLWHRSGDLQVSIEGHAALRATVESLVGQVVN